MILKKLKTCSACNQYTLNELHCNLKTLYAHPPLFNPNDRYGRYRRKQKNMED
ncbi:MAG: nucleolar RNA-binding Nop10p family protein [Candidatus Micrarchaeia archaeon]